MTAKDFRSNPELVKGMRAILESEVMQAALEVMSDEHPVKVIPAEDVTPHFANIRLGQNFGYETYDYRLKLLSKGIEIPQETPPPTYEDDPPPPEE